VPGGIEGGLMLLRANAEGAAAKEPRMTILKNASLALALAGFAAVSGAQAQGFAGSVEGGFQMTDRTNTANNIVNSPYFGGYLAGYGSLGLGRVALAFDGRGEFTYDRGYDNVLATGPLHTGVVGARAGTRFGNIYVGAFAGIGFFDGRDSDQPMRGSIYGIETEYFLPGGGSLYAQLGQARAIGSDAEDNEFDGIDYKIGALFPVNAKSTVEISAEHAISSQCFQDCGDLGRNVVFGLEGVRRLTDRIDLVGTIDYAHVTTNAKATHATSMDVFVGIRVPLGARPTSALRTPMAAFQAASWMHPTD
jgi:hypothetical protein